MRIAEHLWISNGDPTDQDTDILDPEKGDLVLDDTNGTLYQKTSQKGDNSGYTAVVAGRTDYVASSAPVSLVSNITPTTVLTVAGLQTGTLYLAEFEFYYADASTGGNLAIGVTNSAGVVTVDDAGVAASQSPIVISFADLVATNFTAIPAPFQATGRVCGRNVINTSSNTSFTLTVRQEASSASAVTAWGWLRLTKL